VRERQDLVGEWRALDELLVAAIWKPTAERVPVAEQEQRSRLAVIDQALADIDKRFARDFPDYAALVWPEPLALAEAQAQLRSDEALVQFLDTPEWPPMPEKTFICVVTKTNDRWVRTRLGTKALTERIAAFRCGLDATLWTGGDAQDRCIVRLKGAHPRRETSDGQVVDVLPFDLEHAHAPLQRAAWAGRRHDQGKHLLIVPSGPLTTIPFHAPITDKAPAVALPADADGYASAAWLAKRHAITVLPSVAALKALREFAKPSKATQPFIGFGNPLLTGPSGAGQARQGASELRANSAGTGAAKPQHAGPDLPLLPRQPSRRRPGAPAGTAARRVDELCAVARSAGAPETAVNLGEKASETTSRRCPPAVSSVMPHRAFCHPWPARQRVGVCGGLQCGAGADPHTAQPANRGRRRPAHRLGYHAAQARCRLVGALSLQHGGRWWRCPQLGGAVGLGSAFFYAGARTLLVSHWAVDSQATVSLVTKAFDEIKDDDRIGRGEALRRSMLALISSVGRNAHPANWAPFVVVGEGAK
jgi:CHAT domain